MFGRRSISVFTLYEKGLFASHIGVQVMHTILVVGILVGGNVACGSIDELRDAVDDGCACHFHRRRAVDGYRCLGFTYECPVIPVEFSRGKNLSDAFGYERDAFFSLRRNDSAHTGRLSGFDCRIQRRREEVLRMGGRIAFLSL